MTSDKVNMIFNLQGFPYDEVLHMRHDAYHLKWLLVESKSHGVLWHPRGLFLLPTDALDNDTVQSIILSKCGFPLIV
jgi:hypothetical protein